MKKVLGIALVSLLTIGVAFAHGNKDKKGKKGKQCCNTTATAQQKSCSGHASTTDAAPAKSCSGQAAATTKSCSGGASAQKPCCASKAAAAPAEQTK